MPNPLPHLRPRAFTLVELMISMVIISLVGVALVSLGEAVHKGWKTTENQSDLEMSVNGSINQLQALVRSALWIGVVYSDSNVAASDTSTTHGVSSVSPGTVPPSSGAACFIWTGESSISKMYAKDMRLIEHDVGNNALVVWLLPTTAANANTVLRVTDMNSPAKVIQFKNLPNVISRTIATGVIQCKFTGWAVNSSTNIRAVESVISFQRGNAARQWYGLLTPPAIATSADTLPN